MKAHPAAALFPMMTDSELAELAADIKTNGQRQPVITIDDDGERLVLDGRNRLRACEMVGVAPTLVPFGGDDPFALVVSANLHRRHMTASQRAMVAAELAKMKAGRPDKTNAPNGAISEASQDAAAKLLSVSRRVVQRARRVKDHGVPELVAAVVGGEVSVDAASMATHLPLEEQRALVAAGPAALVAAVRRRGDKREDHGPRLAVERNGALAREIAHGVVRARTGEDAKPSHPLKRQNDFDIVRALTEKGYTVHDIAERTGLTKSRIHHIRSTFAPKRSVLAGAIEDAELFAESWASRAVKLPAGWSSASAADIDSLVRALSACRAAAAKAILRLKKEAEKGAAAS